MAAGPRTKEAGLRAAAPRRHPVQTQRPACLATDREPNERGNAMRYAGAQQRAASRCGHGITRRAAKRKPRACAASHSSAHAIHLAHWPPSICRGPRTSDLVLQPSALASSTECLAAARAIGCSMCVRAAMPLGVCTVGRTLLLASLPGRLFGGPRSTPPSSPLRHCTVSCAVARLIINRPFACAAPAPASWSLRLRHLFATD